MSRARAFRTGVAAIAAFSAVLSANAANQRPVSMGRLGKESHLAGIYLNSPGGFRLLLNRFGNPTRIVNGAGTQAGGYNVGGYADGSGGGGGGAAMGGMSAPGMPPALPGAGGAGGYPGMGGGGMGGGGMAAAAGGGGADAGLVTWVYDMPGGRYGVTLMVTFDEQANGSITTIRLLGTRPYRGRDGQTSRGITLGSSFRQVLDAYGYPDMTMPMDYSHTAVYYFRHNLALGFYGNGPGMRIDSITIGIGDQPQTAPAAGGMGGGMPGMGGGMPSMGGGYPGMPAMGGGMPGMGGGMGGYPGMPMGGRGGRMGGMGGMGGATP